MTGNQDAGGADPRRRQRVTIADIAERAGVTIGAVSMAVNGKRGVSNATRERILQVAKELHWRPSHAAQTLMGKNSETIGLVLSRPEEVIGEEIFFAKFIAGVQSVLSQRGYSVQLQMAADVVAEIAIHESWIADGRVDGVILLDPRVDDPRIEVLVALEFPTIVVGGEVETESMRSVQVDNAGAMQLVMEHLFGLGHRRVAHITGDQAFRHTQQRMDSFAAFCIDKGIWGQTIAGNFDPQLAKEATRRLIGSPQPPTALVYDSEVMAIAGMSTLAELGVSVPADVSLVSWEDSTTCQVLHPTVTALNRNAVTLGKIAAAEMLQLLAHKPVEHPLVEAGIVHRESTAPPKTMPTAAGARPLPRAAARD